MNKELFNDIGDLLGYNCYGWDMDVDRKCELCEEIKKECRKLDVISSSSWGNRRQVIMCKSCFKIMWPPPNKEREKQI